MHSPKRRKDKNFWEYYIVILGYWIKFAPYEKNTATDYPGPVFNGESRSPDADSRANRHRDNA